MRMRKVSGSSARSRDAKRGVVRRVWGGGLLRGVESLESRTLFALTATTPFNDVTVPVGAAPATLNLRTNFATTISGTTVRYSVSYGTVSQNIDIELFDQNTPLTVANFLRYVDSGRYNGTFFHRLAINPNGTPFVLQGGGYAFPAGDPPTHIPTFGNVANEFSTSPRYGGKVNVQGTVAMAKLGGDPNSATSEYFFNLNDNSGNLDSQNGGFTTFASVVGTGSTSALQQITALPQVNLFPQNTNSPFGEIPLANYSTNTAPGSLTQSNYVYISSVRRISPIQFQVSSSSSSVIPAVDTNGVLTLSYAPGDATPATVTIVATDLTGSTLTRTFNVGFSQASGIAVSLGGNRLDNPAGSRTANLGVFRASTNVVTATIALRSVGSQDLSNLTVSTTGGFVITNAASVPSSLAVGDIFNLNITAPTDRFGQLTGTLRVLAAGSAQPDISIPLSAVVRLPVVLGSGSGASAVRSVTLTSESVTHTFSLSGPGTAEFLLDGNAFTVASPRGGNVVISGSATVPVITLSGTSDRSVLTETVRGKGALMNVGTITSTGTASLNSLTFKNVNLTGSLTIGTSSFTNAILRSLTLGAVTNATVFLGRNSDPKATASITIDRVTASTVSVGYAVTAMKVNTWDAGTNVVSLVAENGVKTLSINSDFGGTVSVSGNVVTAAIKGRLTGGSWETGNVASFTAGSVGRAFEMTVNGVLSKATISGDYVGYINAIGIGNFTAGSGLGEASDTNSFGPALLASGGQLDGTQRVTGDMGKITFRGAANVAYIYAANTIGSFTANSIYQTRLYAGPQLGQNSVFPTSGSAFNNPSRIGSITLVGKNVSNAFSTSAISAKLLGKVNLSTVDLNVNFQNGIVAGGIESLQLVARGANGALTPIRRQSLNFNSAPVAFSQQTGVVVQLLQV